MFVSDNAIVKYENPYEFPCLKIGKYLVHTFRRKTCAYINEEHEKLFIPHNGNERILMSKYWINYICLLLNITEAHNVHMIE